MSQLLSLLCDFSSVTQQNKRERETWTSIEAVMTLMSAFIKHVRQDSFQKASHDHNMQLVTDFNSEHRSIDFKKCVTVKSKGFFWQVVMTSNCTLRVFMLFEAFGN